MSFSSKIIAWYNLNKRDLPWRNTKGPYLIWLSEIILQQTRVDQGMAYYHKFAEKYPNVKSLADANEDDVLRLWQGLGYYSRARNLHKAAKQIVNDFGGKFPKDYESILSLSGVGEYTAAAISSFAYELEYPVVDGNVFRLLSRYFGIKTPIDTGKGKKEFTKVAGELIKGSKPSLFNQAIMEFGSRQCSPAKPDCVSCKLNSSCYAFSKNKVSSFPVKKNKTKSRDRYFHYVVVRQKNSFYIKKRKEKDIWQGLHDFPLIETSEKLNENLFIGSTEWKKTIGKGKFKLEKVSEEFKHVLSHQLIYAKFYEISFENKILNEPNVEWIKVNKESVKKYALPRLIEKYLEG